MAFLAQSLAAAGGRIVSSIGVMTTMLVISQDQPFGKYFTSHADRRPADQMRQAGSSIEIVLEREIRSRLAVPLAC
ncbi:MAG: hypothetical protein EOO83_00910 [Oxalobacteraceae bacterium]|nr:MAG: hypothetical protein EOO83_00910 [Oxalobacteraceae bacterium]